MNTNNAVQLQDKIDGHNIYPKTLASLVQTADGSNIEDEKANKSDVYTKSQVNALLEDKQNTLVSGSNIKTVNGQSILGAGNINAQVVQNLNNESTPRHFLMSTVAHSGDAGDADYSNEVVFTPTTRIMTVITTKNPDTEQQVSYPVNIENGSVTFGMGGADGHINAEEYTGRAINSESYVTQQIMETLAATDEIHVGLNDGASKIGFYNEDEEPVTVKEGILSKQDKLVSGTNIKTINSSSILGNGNLTLAGLDEATSRSVIYKALKQGEEQMLILKSMSSLDVMPIDSSLEQYDLNEDGTINYAEISIIYSILLNRPYEGFYYRAIHQTDGDDSSPLILQKSEDRETWTTVTGKNPDLHNDGHLTATDVSALYNLIETIAEGQGIAYDRSEFTGMTTVFSAFDSKEKKIVIGYNFERYIDPTYNTDDYILLKLDPSPNVIYCNSFNNKLYRWNESSEKMVELNLATTITSPNP